MKLLFDQNISFRIISSLEKHFPNCSQVRLEELENFSDLEIWKYAKNNNFSIVSFDADFYDLSILKGIPPKIIWLRLGNTSTDSLKNILIEKKETIIDFLSLEKQKTISCLEISSS